MDGGDFALPHAPIDEKKASTLFEQYPKRHCTPHAAPETIASRYPEDAGSRYAQAPGSASHSFPRPPTDFALKLAMARYELSRRPARCMAVSAST